MVDLKSWVDTVMKSSKQDRHRLKNKVLEGVEYFNAKWRKKNPGNGVAPDYDLNKKDPAAQRLVKELKNNNEFECVGFAPNVSYIKLSGSKKQMNVIWDHPFAHPALIYAHKHLPCIIITGPNIMFDDSILNKIPENRYDEPVGGWTG